MPFWVADDRGSSDYNTNSRHNGRRRRTSSLTMVRASTQQIALDRIVGTVAIVGLSVAFARWLTNNNDNNGGDGRLPPASRRKRRQRARGWMPWWWPVIAMQRWNERNRTTTENGVRADDSVVVRGGGEDSANDDGEHLHQGSCHCGSIKFVLRGPRRLRAVDLPGKIRYPHVPISATRFQLISGEDRMRFYYEDDNNDDSSSIAFDRAGEGRRGDAAAADQASGAHSFCGNCGVHVFHADRSSGRLEVNANCLDGGGASEARPVYREQASSGVSSVTNNTTVSQSQYSQHSTTCPENVGDVDEDAGNPAIETVSDIDRFSGGGATPSTGLDYNNLKNSIIARKESLSSEPTHPESYSTAIMAEGDDLSMGSSLSVITGAYLPSYHCSSHSVASGSANNAHGGSNRTGLRPPQPSRIPPPGRSAKGLPPQPAERSRYGSGERGGINSGINGGGWSVASGESNDLDGVDAEQTTIESYSTAIMAEGDDSSMGSLSVTGYSSHSVASASASASASAHDRSNRTGLPPLPPSRIPSSDRSAKTLPSRLGERSYGSFRGVRGGSINGSGWSVASMESNELDGVDDVEQTTISPRMRDQMKKYLGRHINPIQED